MAPSRIPSGPAARSTWPGIPTTPSLSPRRRQMDDPRIERALEEFFESERLSRRRFLGRAGSSSLALSGLAAVLAACGGVEGEGREGLEGQVEGPCGQPPQDGDRRLDLRELA